MKRFRVIIPPFVQEQIRAQVVYIAQDSVDNALAWEDRLRAAINAIGITPGHPIDENATSRLGTPVHKFVFEGTYLIHYVINDEADTVEVINFRHGMRLPTRGEP